MGKSVYSIVLDDEVVAAIDELAYRAGTNRSGLVNSILAERVGCVTPEMRMQEIFSIVQSSLDPRFLPSPQPSGSVLLVKTALRYKYKPTLKYSVELFRSFSGCVGRLKVSLRSQSAELTELCGEFFGYWMAMEKRLCGGLFKGGFPAEVTQKGYTRDFFEVGTGGLSDKEIAESITGYISCLDRAISLTVEAGSAEAAAEECEGMYKEYLADGVRII